MKSTGLFHTRMAWAVLVLLAGLLGPAGAADPSAGSAESPEPTTLRCWGIPPNAASIPYLATLRVLDAFRQEHPHIQPVSSRGLEIPGRTMDMVPLMQIAGGIPADVMYVNFRKSHTYIDQGFLYPLEGYIEQMLGLSIPDSQNLSTEEYLERLKTSPQYETQIARRVPPQTWAVMRRLCPHGKDCPYARVNGGELDFEPTEKHYHVWAFPQGTLLQALFYRKDLFREASLPDRVPRDYEEFIAFAQKLTNKQKNRFGLRMQTGEALSWGTLSFLYSVGGRLVDRNEKGQWVCTFDSPEAVEAYWFVARLFHEPFVDAGGRRVNGVVYTGEARGGQVFVGMEFQYVSEKTFSNLDSNIYNFGPVPQGPNGRRGSEFNARMTGIYAGLAEDKPSRDAAWEYIQFYNGPQARTIRTDVYVANGLARFVQPWLLREAGFDEYVRQVPEGWAEAYQKALANGVPEPYGKNCQNVYYYASRAINQIQTDETIVDQVVAWKQAIEAGDTDRADAIERQAKERIAAILARQVQASNEKMLDILAPETRRFRNTIASIVAVAILLLFAGLFWWVFRIFDQAQVRDPMAPKGKWMFGKFHLAYLLLLIPVGSVLLWQYYPLIRGTVIAFQNYNIRGSAEWVGMSNFSNALFDREFWYSMWVTLKYALLFGCFGFTMPILLAFLLSEVPRGKVLFRTIYYLPAVLSGLIMIFLWKSFYGEFGMINEVINVFINGWNWITGSAYPEFHKNWLNDPDLALICILLPVIWAGMGPGCLIYLAALKTIPEDIYEAADIDGAGIGHKVVHIALPSIRMLLMINFIGVMVATIKGGGNFALAMTGGGPYAPYGETELVSLKIFLQAFGYLRFGVATAMAWILGSMLVGFTVFQLQKLSKVEFKTATGQK